MHTTCLRGPHPAAVRPQQGRLLHHADQKQQQLFRCSAASSDCSPITGKGAGSSGSGAHSTLHQQQQTAQQVPTAVPLSHNNALPMPRNTAAAATAVAVAAAPVSAPQSFLQQQDEAATPGRLQQQVQRHQHQLRFNHHHLNNSSSSRRTRPTSSQQQDPAAAAAAVRHSRQLTKSIMACSSQQELQQLYQRHVGQLNLINLSAMFKQLTRCCCADEQHQHQANDHLPPPQQQQRPQQQQGWWTDDWVALPGQQQQQQHGQYHHQQQQPSLLQQLELHSLRLLSTVQQPPASAVQVMLTTAVSPQLLHPAANLQQQQQLLGADGSGSGSRGRDAAGRRHPMSVALAPVQPQQLSTICWSCASLGHQPSQDWWAVYWAASTLLLHTYSSRELATAISAAGKLQQVPPASWMSGFEAACVNGRLAQSTPQELCMLLQGVAALRLQPGSSWVGALQAAVLQQLDSLSPRDISQVLWGHARLCVDPPSPWLCQLLAAASAQVPSFSAHDTAMLLWALAALSCEHPQQQQQLVAGLVGGLYLSSCKLRAATPQDLAHISWALATFERTAAAAAAPAARLDTHGSRANTDTHGGSGGTHQQQHQQQQQQQTWAGLYQVQPLVAAASSGLSEGQLASWFRSTWQMTHPAGAGSSTDSNKVHAPHHQQQQQCQQQRQQQQQQQQLTFTDAAQLLWSSSQLPRSCWPTEDWLAHFWSRAAADLQQAPLPACQKVSAHSLTVALWASVKVGQRPPGSFLMAATPLLQRQLAELQPPAACQLLYVLAKLQHRPNPGFMEQLLSRLQLDSHQLEPRAFACVLWALGRLGYQPGVTWWSTVLMHLQGLVGQLGQRELANVLFGLLALGVLQPAAPGSSSSSSGASGSSASDDGGAGMVPGCGGGDGSISSSSSSSSGVVELPRQLREALLRRAAEQLGADSCCRGDSCSPADVDKSPLDEASPAGAAAAVWQAGDAPSSDGSVLDCQPPLQQLLACLEH